MSSVVGTRGKVAKTRETKLMIPLEMVECLIWHEKALFFSSLLYRWGWIGNYESGKWGGGGGAICKIGPRERCWRARVWIESERKKISEIRDHLRKRNFFSNRYSDNVTIDVWEGASGASADAAIFGLKSNSFSNARKKFIKTWKKLKITLQNNHILPNNCR